MAFRNCYSKIQLMERIALDICNMKQCDKKFKSTVKAILSLFCDNGDLEEYTLPNTLNKQQREFIHKECWKMGFISKSIGNGTEKSMIVKRKCVDNQKTFVLYYNEGTNKNIDSVFANIRNERIKSPKPYISSSRILGNLSNIFAVKVDSVKSNKYLNIRRALPTWFKKKDILELIKTNQIILVCAETGSGKTTQIPQYILEDACDNNVPCKIICTQPRRIATISVAERVSEERGERLGGTVGYQMRLESRVGMQTALIYCTTGILLRTLMGDPKRNLEQITHIIIDEIHERDKYIDFLLISLKICLMYYPKLKVILMSATPNIDSFVNYLPDVKVLHIPGKQHKISELFLEDILLFLHQHKYSGAFSNEKEVNVDDSCSREELDSAITECVKCGDDDTFAHLMQLILSENADVNYQTVKDGYTPLMAAAIHGNIEILSQLLNLCPNTELLSYKPESYTASRWSLHYHKKKAFELLKEYSQLSIEDKQITELSRELVSKYDESNLEDKIDFDLIINIIKYIQLNDCISTILVFLPGYDDLMICRDLILLDSTFQKNDVEIFTLHSNVPISSQLHIFSQIPAQKIILATNIAETSITIPDVVYVIDSGLVKEKSYDSYTGTGTLKKCWISKSNAKQRAGRAGRTRPGVCYHIFSKDRFNCMLDYAIPEILREPLLDLCLQTKLLAPSCCSIAGYLQKAIDPPSKVAVSCAIQTLRMLGAIDENEELTQLGKHLLQFSIDPRLGKILIFAVIFKCLDPVLTIVAALAHQDPFILPQQSSAKSLAAKKQRELAGDSFSDHVTLLRAFQKWQFADGDVEQSNIIDEYFINNSTMMSINATRQQLLSQLRAAGFVQSNKPFSIQDLNSNSDQWHLIKAALTVGYYPNIAFKEGDIICSKNEKRLHFTRNSCLNKLSYFEAAIIYNELLKSNQRCTVRCGTLVTPLTIALLCGKVEDTENDSILSIDGWFNVQHEYQNLKQFRSTVLNVLNFQIQNPCSILNNEQNRVMQKMHEVLASEERCYSMPNIEGIGLAPKLFPLDGQYLLKKKTPSRGSQQKPRFSNFTRSEQLPVKSSNYGVINNAAYYLTEGDLDGNVAHFSKNEYKNNFSLNTNNGFEVYNDSTVGNLLSKQLVNSTKQDHLLMAIDRFNENTALKQAVDIAALEWRIQNHISTPGNSTESSPSSNILTRANCRLPGNSKFIFIKPPSESSFSKGVKNCVWHFTPSTERKVFRLYNSNPVYLVFSIAKSNTFQAFAKLLDTNNGDVNKSCPIEWISIALISHARLKDLKLSHLCNCQDGQELDNNEAIKLCSLFFENENFLHKRPVLGRF